MLKKILSALIVSTTVFSFSSTLYAAGISVSAKSAMLIEASTQNIVYEINSNEKLPMASTTKIMTALVAIENSDLNKVVTVSNLAVGVEGSSIYLRAGEQLTMLDLVYALMLESANDAATAIAIDIAGSIEGFAAMMNEKAAQIGLTSTSFTNPHGLDNENHYTTAYELAKLAAYALNNPTFAAIVSTYKHSINMYGGEGTRLLLNHNKMLKYYTDAIGVKTGFTKRSGRCLVSAARRNGVTMVAVTLNAPNDWNDHTTMLDYGFTKYESVALTNANSLNIQIPCIGGNFEYVEASNKSGLNVCIPIENMNITSTTELKRFYYAPISKGDELGRIIYYNNGEIIGVVPIIATQGVEVVTYKKSLWELIMTKISN